MTPRAGRAWKVTGLLVVLSPLSWLAGMTADRYTGHDFAGARARFPAVVESCRRHGPVTLRGGFGTWYSCRLTIGARTTRTVDDPGFFPDDQTGRTITVGETRVKRGKHTRTEWSRPELPQRTLLDIAVVALWLPAAAIAVVVLFVLGVLLRRRRPVGPPA
jgi:hypothetical protein